MLARTTRLFSEQPAIKDSEGTFTWAQLGDRVGRAAAVLRSLGVRRGDRFGILSRNSYRQAEVIYAGYWLGAIPVPVNFRLAPPEIAQILDDAECGLLVVEDAFADLLAQLGPRDTLRIGTDPEDVSQPHYDALLAEATPVLPVDAAEDDDALLIYTGGTTGRAKGVPLTHRNIVTNAMQIGLAVSPRADDVALHVAPMFHSADLLNNPFVLSGGAHVYLPKFSTEAVGEAIDAFGVTTVVLTPTMIVLLLQDSRLDRRDLSSLRQVVYGSSPMAAESIREAVERFPTVEWIQVYGLTETAPILTALSMADHLRGVRDGQDELLRSVGQPLVGIELKIVGPEGEVPTGESGEAVVRGPNVARGYWRRPDATAEAFRDGWFHTGDVGRLDATGRLYLLDRMKDLIITGGELVYSLEVEAALRQHPAVHECAVVGVPDEVYGEALLAAVVLAPGEAATDAELIEHCRARIGGYKIPRRYVFLDELPRSAMNKVLKNELRRRYGAEQGARV
jgi:long-chain acyl-CoA synthetase